MVDLTNDDRETVCPLSTRPKSIPMAVCVVVDGGKCTTVKTKDDLLLEVETLF